MRLSCECARRKPALAVSGCVVKKKIGEQEVQNWLLCHRLLYPHPAAKAPKPTGRALARCQGACFPPSRLARRRRRHADPIGLEEEADAADRPREMRGHSPYRGERALPVCGVPHALPHSLGSSRRSTRVRLSRPACREEQNALTFASCARRAAPRTHTRRPHPHLYVVVHTLRLRANVARQRCSAGLCKPD